MQIYFATMGERIKVGISRSPMHRMTQLSRDNGGVPIQLIGTIKGDVRREKEIHNALRAHRLVGEWYKDGPETRALIQNCFNNFDAADPAITLKNENFGKVWKALFPRKAAEELAARTGCSVRKAMYEISGRIQPSAQSIRALVDLCVPPWKRG